VFGTIVKGSRWLCIVINDKTASRFMGLIAFPLEGRRVVIPIHYNIIIKRFLFILKKKMRLKAVQKVDELGQ